MPDPMPVVSKPDLFARIGAFITSFFSNQYVNAGWHAALGGVATYVVQNGLVFHGSPWVALGGAALGGLIGYARGTGNPTASQIADVVQAAIDKNKTPPTPPAAVAVTP